MVLKVIFITWAVLTLTQLVIVCGNWKDGKYDVRVTGKRNSTIWQDLFSVLIWPIAYLVYFAGLILKDFNSYLND